MGMLAIADGRFREAMFWLLVTLVIDGIDGTFARLAQVGERLPHVNGKTIDYVIDFFTYAILPAYLFYEAADMPETGRLLCAFAMLLSAALYYGLEGMTTEDGKHFVGFPVLWNAIVYLLIFAFPDMGAGPQGLVVGIFTVLHFVPILVPYPSKGGTWWVGTLLAVVAFLTAAVMIVWQFPAVDWWWRALAAGSSLWFVVVTLVDTLRADS